MLKAVKFFSSAITKEKTTLHKIYKWPENFGH